MMSIYGGSTTGTMGAVSRGVLENGGEVGAFIPSSLHGREMTKADLTIFRDGAEQGIEPAAAAESRPGMTPCGFLHLYGASLGGAGMMRYLRPPAMVETMRYKPWTDEEVARLIELAENGATVTRAAGALGRSMASVEVKARSFGKPLLGIRRIRASIRNADEDARNRRR
jgi:hypothetical protein